MKPETVDAITSWGMAAIAALIIIWDVVAPRLGGQTESQLLATYARKWNILPLALGVLVGHWAWQSSTPMYDLWKWGLIPVGLVLAHDLAFNFLGLPSPGWLRYPGLWAMAGMPLGALLWGQRMP